MKKKKRTINLYVQIPIETKNQLLLAIDGKTIYTISDAVQEAARLLETREPRIQKGEPAA